MNPEGSRSLTARAGQFVGNTVESACACAVVMVQGQLLLLSAAHWLIALQTGLLAGALSSVLLAFGRAPRPWVLSVVLGLATAVADFIVHSGDLLDVLMEAVITGIGAAVLAYALTYAFRWLRRSLTA
jgi:hypothetical protein